MKKSQISDPESGRITSASPTGRPAESAPVYLSPERGLSTKGQTSPVLSSDSVGSDAARYSSDFQADDCRPRLSLNGDRIRVPAKLI
jgi:hypothetical protein